MSQGRTFQNLIPEREESVHKGMELGKTGISKSTAGLGERNRDIDR